MKRSSINQMRNIRSKRTRFGIGIVFGAAIGIIVSQITGEWEYAILSAWDGFALALMAQAWRDFRSRDPRETARLARHDRLSPSSADAVLIFASTASLVAVIALLVGQDHSLIRVGFALGSIILSWMTVHTVYMVRYAVMYYDNHQDGIDFSSHEQPTFIDFAYVAFTIGMTYQVSDTTFTSTRFRRIALRHALLSFVFGTAIIATSINFLASLSK